VIGGGGFQRAARVAREREEFDLDARAGTAVGGVEHVGSELAHSQISLCRFDLCARFRRQPDPIQNYWRRIEAPRQWLHTRRRIDASAVRVIL
jgi:hypothetical protein